MRNIFMISILAFKRGSSGNNSIVATFTDIIFYKTHQNINRCFFSKAGKWPWVVLNTTGFQMTDSVTVIKCLRPWKPVFNIKYYVFLI